MLPRNYWLPAKRVSAGNSSYFAWPGNVTIPDNVSTNPYAHWGWYYPFLLTSSGYDCVYASEPLAYDLYMGGSSKDDYTNSLNYLTNEANKAGWNLGLCSLKYYFICEALSTVFPCYPPPSPPTPPPSPPSPPSPPMPPTCESRVVLACTAAGNPACHSTRAAHGGLYSSVAVIATGEHAIFPCWRGLLALQPAFCSQQRLHCHHKGLPHACLHC